jgi:hypothetical protein
MPGAFTLGMWLLRKTRQCLLMNCMKGASQSAWNAAWVGDQFLLNARSVGIADNVEATPSYIKASVHRFPLPMEALVTTYCSNVVAQH